MSTIPVIKYTPFPQENAAVKVKYPEIDTYTQLAKIKNYRTVYI